MRSGADPGVGQVVGGAERIDRWLAPCVALVSLALFAALAWPMLSGRVYGGDDLTLFHLPMRWFYWNSLHNGDSFDWLPDILCGFYLTGEGQAGTYHPVHLLLYRWLAFPAAFNLEVWLSYPAMFAGMVLLLSRSALGETKEFAATSPDRRSGVHAEGLPPHAAMFGAMLFTFSASCALHFIHMNAIAVVAHLPWLLWAIDVGVRAERERHRVLAFAAIAALTASTLLCGHPQYVWICFVAELFWLWLANWIASDAGTARAGLRGATRTVLRFGVAKFVGALIGAIQLLPTLDHLLHSQRHETTGGVANHGALHPLNVVQFLAPYVLPARVEGLNTHEFGAYAGVVPVVLMVWLCSQRAGLGPARRPLLAVALFGATAFLLSLGGYGGIYGLLTLLPGIGEFRLPARYLLLVHLATAILAAAALARLPSGIHAGPQAAWPGGWKLAAFSAALTLELRLLLPLERLGSPLGAAIGPLLFVVAIAVFTLALRGVRIATPLLIVLTAADAGTYGMSYAVWPGARRLEAILANLPPPPSTAVRLATFQPDEKGMFTGNQWIMRGWRLSDGYAGLLPPDRLDRRTLAGLRMSNTGFVLRRGDEPPVDGLDVVDKQMDGVPDPLPRLRLATRAIVSATPTDDANSLAAESLATTALVDDAMSLEGPAGEARFRSDRPGALEIEVHAPHRQLLVIADRYHEGWRALVNGSPVGVHRVDGDFMGVPVDAGESAVRLTFEPSSLRYGKALSLTGLVALALMLGGGVLRTRDAKRRPREDLHRAPERPVA